jgi:hypothetical protein
MSIRTSRASTRSRSRQSERCRASTVEWALANDVTCYGDGQFEFDVGRGHLHELAATFHPGPPNDVALASYNGVDFAASLAASPLHPPADAVDLRWD